MGAFGLRDVQNMENVAVVTAIIAEVAIFPLKWQADVRGKGAELTFCVGGMFGDCR